MADTTSNYPATFLQPFGETLADYTISELQRPLDISGILPRIAAIDPFTQAAQQRAATQAGLGQIQYDPEGRIAGFGQGTGIAAFEPYLQRAGEQVLAGPSAYQQYMSPYQQDIINTTLANYDVQAQKGLAPLAARAIQSGAFGGAREGIQKAEYQAASDRNRAALEAQLRQQGFTQAQGLAQQGLANLLAFPGAQQGFEQSLQTQLGAMGTGSQAYAQNILNAIQQGELTAMNFPFQRLQQATNIFGGLASGTPSTPGVPLVTSPNVAGMGGLGALAGIAGPLSNIIGSVVKGVGSVFDGSTSQTPTTFPDTGGYDFPSIYSDPYRSSSPGDIYDTGDYIF